MVLGTAPRGEPTAAEIVVLVGAQIANIPHRRDTRAMAKIPDRWGPPGERSCGHNSLLALADPRASVARRRRGVSYNLSSCETRREPTVR